MSAIVRLLGLCARCWESTAPSATVRTELGACPDAVREMVGDAKLEHDQLRAALDTALRESTEVIAQRDTALGLCKERERVIATVTAESAERGKALDVWRTENADLKRRIGNLAASHDLPRVQDVARIYELEQSLAKVTADREWHRKVAEQMADERLSERAAHAETRKALEEMQQARAGATAAYESTRAKLAKAEARVKELERENTELQTFRTVFSKDRLRG